jgi:glycosyltransferase involved in cell wall biosynthesis
LHKRLLDLRVRADIVGIRQAVDAVACRIGSRLTELDDPPLVRWSAPLPQNALPAALRALEPDAVVASSLDRAAWLRVRSELVARHIMSVLYFREESSLGHLTISQAPADVHVANAAIHTERAMRLGYACTTIPSVVELDACRVESSRQRILFVNPIDISGVDIAIEIARSRPELSFAFAESWRLDGSQLDALYARLTALPNVEFRLRVDDPRRVYADARVLLAPYLTNGRARVVLEAQANGIPVLGTNIPAMREAIGPGGCVVDPDGPVATWCMSLDAMLEPRRYEELVAAAFVNAARDEIDPDRITAAFEEAVAPPGSARLTTPRVTEP